jgi:hypothetical protein
MRRCRTINRSSGLRHGCGRRRHGRKEKRGREARVNGGQEIPHLRLGRMGEGGTGAALEVGVVSGGRGSDGKPNRALCKLRVGMARWR